MSWIDSHIHLWTKEVGEFPLAEGMTTVDLDPPDFTPEMYLSLIHISEPTRPY